MELPMYQKRVYIILTITPVGEGIRLVKKSMAYLLKTGHIWLIPGLFLQSVSKYAGYFLGKRYKKLPEKMIRSCTMNPEYWKKNK